MEPYSETRSVGGGANSGCIRSISISSNVLKTKGLKTSRSHNTRVAIAKCCLKPHLRKVLLGILRRCLWLRCSGSLLGWVSRGRSFPGALPLCLSPRERLPADASCNPLHRRVERREDLLVLLKEAPNQQQSDSIATTEIAENQVKQHLNRDSPIGVATADSQIQALRPVMVDATVQTDATPDLGKSPSRMAAASTHCDGAAANTPRNPEAGSAGTGRSSQSVGQLSSEAIDAQAAQDWLDAL